MKHGTLVKTAALFLLLLTASPAAAQNVQTYIDRGMENCEKGRYAQAISDFNQALKLKPNDPALITYRGVAKYAKGQNQEALEDFNRALQIDPKHARAYYHRAMIYENREDYDKALPDLKQAKDLGHGIDPDFIKLVEKKAAQKK